MAQERRCTLCQELNRVSDHVVLWKSADGVPFAAHPRCQARRAKALELQGAEPDRRV